MSETRQSQNVPHVKINPISDLLNDDELLDLRRANGLEIPLQSWLEFSLSLYNPKAKTTRSDEILVPVLLSRDSAADDGPVPKTYNAIPRRLYQKVKNRIQDLLNKSFIRKSTPHPYASAVVFVRKKAKIKTPNKH